jgi:hypothetical protein
MSDEADRILFTVGGKVAFESETMYLNRLFPQLYSPKLNLLAGHEDAVSITIFSRNENPRALVVLSGVFNEAL